MVNVINKNECTLRLYVVSGEEGDRTHLTSVASGGFFGGMGRERGGFREGTGSSSSSSSSSEPGQREGEKELCRSETIRGTFTEYVSVFLLLLHPLLLLLVHREESKGRL